MSITIKNVQLAFPNVFVAKGFEDGTPDFNLIALIEPGSANAKLIEAESDRVGAEKFGEKWPAVKKELMAKDRMALHDGDNKASLAGFAGMQYISARNKTRPTAVNRDRSPLQESDGLIYSGVYANVVIDCWAMSNNYGKRICASLLGIQHVKHGEAFSGGGVASVDSFEALDDDEIDDLV
jgi:hypothetical protein